MSKIAYVLELTEEEAEVLLRLTDFGVSWARSGEFGATAETVCDALLFVGVRYSQPEVRPHHNGKRVDCPEWK